MIKLKVGNLYDLPHGRGKLLGKEVFDSDGNTAPLDIKNLEGTEYTRFIFKIDGACKWAKLMNTTNYACVKKDIKELK